MRKEEPGRFTDREARRMHGVSTRVYLRNVMMKVYPGKWTEHLRQLLGGDRPTLDFCAKHLEKNLDYFPLLHTLCLVTGQRFDLAQADHAKAADAWLCWFCENEGDLVWNEEEKQWELRKPSVSPAPK